MPKIIQPGQLARVLEKRRGFLLHQAALACEAQARYGPAKSVPAASSHPASLRPRMNSGPRGGALTPRSTVNRRPHPLGKRLARRASA